MLKTTRVKFKWGFLISLVMIGSLFALLAASPNNAYAAVSRYGGYEAADTAVEITKAAFPNGSKNVVVARDDDYMDSMSATGLAGVLDAPILLTDRFTLSESTRAQIKSMNAENVYLIGGTVAIKSDVEKALKDMGLHVERIYGTDACDTSVKCAERIEVIQGGRNSLDTAIVATSVDFVDALSVSSYAYKYQLPIFILTEGSTAVDRHLRADAQAMISKYASVFVPGGPGATPTEAVEGVFGTGKVTRIYGITGFDTSDALARYLTSGTNLLSSATIGVANGNQAPKGVDALAASTLCAKNDAAIILTDNTTSSKTIISYLYEHYETIDSALIFGGTAVCSYEIQVEIEKTLRGAIQFVTIIGSDYWTSATTKHHMQGSDLLMLMRLDTEAGVSNLINIPRDTHYDHRGMQYGTECNCKGEGCRDNQTWYKANYAYHYGYYLGRQQGMSESEAVNNGAQKACEAVSDITGAGVKKYALVDLMTFQKLVDNIGGVKVDVPYSIAYTFYDDKNNPKTIHSINSGQQLLTGWNAMILSRSRTSYSENPGVVYNPISGAYLDQDVFRQIANRRMMMSLMRYGINSGATADLLNGFVSLGLIKTNISSEEISNWANVFASKASSITVHGATGPNYGYTMNINGLDQWLIPVNPDAWKALMNEVCSGVSMTSYGAETQTM